MVSRNRKIARRIGQAVANDVLDISGAISAGAGVTVYATLDDLPTTGLTAGDEAFVSGSNRLYISNGAGWYSIGLVNTNPAITSVEDPSSNTTPFTLATDGSALVLTITAADPEGFPLTYNYAVTTGSLTNGGGTTATVGQGTGEGYAISSASILSGTHTVNANVGALTFKPDGTEMYYVGTHNDRVNRHTLSTAWDVSTASFVGSSPNTLSQVSQLTDAKFNNDGTKMYMADKSTNTIYQYSLSTAWNVGTASYDNKSYDSSSVLTGGELGCFVFNSDGSAVYLAEHYPNRKIYQFTLSTAFDISTATYSNKSLDFASEAVGRPYFQFTNDGKKLFMINTFHTAGYVGKIYEYSLTTGYDISTASHTSVTYTPTGITTGRSAIAFKPDGSKMFIMGTDNHTTISQFNLPVYNANQFIITPTTTEAHAGTFDLTFTTSDGINQASSVNSFTLNFITIIANSRYTTLLTTAVDTSDNNNITDASTNNHTITVNGDAYAGSFSPYRSGGYSISLNGTDESFEPNHSSASGLGTTWSVSYWAYIPSSGTTNGTPYIFDFDRLYSSGNGFALQANLSFKNFSLTLASVGAIINTATGLTCFDKWSYYVITHSSGTTTFYIDGSSVGSSTNSAMANVSAANVQQLVIGADRYATSSYHTKMDVRDFHVRSAAHNGAVNNEATVADSNTVILAAHKSYPAAQTGASTALAPVINNSVSTKPFSPYDYAEYDAADHGGSVYFDGSGDTISTYHASNLQLGASSAFTLELWFYANGTSSDYQSLFSTYSGSSASDAGQSARLIFNTSNNLFILTDGSSNFLQVTKVVPQKTWNHFCWTRDASNNHKFYFNGEQIGTSTSSTNFQTDLWYFGRRQFNGDQDFTGYISDISLIKGSVTRTSAFTPPTVPLSSTGAALHIKGADASIIDKSQVNNIKMNGPTTGSTTKSAFGSEPTISFASGSNTNRYLNFDPTVLKFMEILGKPSIPFTIEGIWGWQGSTASPIFEIFQDTNNFFYFGGGPGGTRSGITTDNNLYAIFKIGGVERFKMTAGIGSYNNVGSSFKHQAITRNSSGVMQHYYDGQLRTNTITHSGYDTVSWTSPVGYVGRSDWMGIYGRYEGYIHQIRLTVGLARYTANFTAPTASLEG
jgi:hypothetical protein